MDAAEREQSSPNRTVIPARHRWQSSAQPRGLICPACHCPVITNHGKKVTNTVQALEGTVKRRYVCRNCGRTWWSVERFLA